MVKSKSGNLAKLPKEQRCQFLIGPVSSWFKPNISDIWTQPARDERDKLLHGQDCISKQEQLMDCDNGHASSQDIASEVSYFIYGSIGCFCFGEIHHRSQSNENAQSSSGHQPNQARLNSMSATVKRLIDFKEDNSKVSCVRFLKKSILPIAMVYTESGSLLVHDCVSDETLFHLRPSELVSRFIKPLIGAQEATMGEPCSKKARYNRSYQFNSCVWPSPQNAFLGISLSKEKASFLVWLKLINPHEIRAKSQLTGSEVDIIESHQMIDLKLPQYSPICCMEAISIDSESCLVAVALDDGLITVIEINYDGGTKRVVKLVRHKDQICSMSFFVENLKKFPMGLLASVSRDGLVCIWDIDNEYYFADFITTSDCKNNANSQINWFALSFITSKTSKYVHLAVSNPSSGLTILEIPENARSKIRLRDNKDKSVKKHVGEQTILHHALIFNVIFDPLTETILTSSLDGNHVLWSCEKSEFSNNSGKKEVLSLEVKPQFLIPALLNTSRTHMLRHSPIREDLLGVALGKGGIKFYKIAENQTNHRFDMSPSCLLIARKIAKASSMNNPLSPASLSWHPSHEYRLAVGTLEGKVLRIDITPRKATLIEAEHKPVARLPKNSSKEASQVNDDLFGVDYQPLEHCDEDAEVTSSNEACRTGAIYSLCWGPNPSYPEDLSRLSIYAIGSNSHRLFIYSTNKENGDSLTNYLDDFLDQSLPEANGEVSEVAWKSSLDLMALGTTTGKIMIVKYLDESHADRSKNRLFKKLAVIQGLFGDTHIQCIAWHPTTDKDDAHYYCIAASAEESPAFVFNLRENILVADMKARLKIQEGTAEGTIIDVTSNIVSVAKFTLDGHKKAITDIGWNPHESNELATSSFDRFCYVWSLDDSKDVDASARITSKFSARDRLFTLEWSLVDTDLIFTSGNDSTIWAWRPSENRAIKCSGGGTL